MQLSRRLKKLASVVGDVQVELKKIMRELSRIDDEELAGLIDKWLRELDEALTYLDEAENIMWDVAEEMEREGL
jgi:uncharacterized membrane protein